MKKRIRNAFLNFTPIIAARSLRGLSRLVRTRIVGLDQIQQLGLVNFAHWHGDELVLLPIFGPMNVAILVSHSRDGEVMAKGARFLGFHITRGSSSRGAVGGLMALIKTSRQGFHVSLAVDGPKGPRHVCKPGVVRLSQKAKVPLIPVGVAVSRAFVFKKTWNKTFLPLPFSRQVVFLDQPLFFDQDKTPESLEVNCRRVETALKNAHEKACQTLSQWQQE